MTQTPSPLALSVMPASAPRGRIWPISSTGFGQRDAVRSSMRSVVASRHESVGSVRLLRTYGDHAARIDVSRRNGLRSTPSVGVQM